MSLIDYISNFFRPEPADSTAFSEFIRKASASKKKQVYSKVLKRASERQNKVVERARSRAESRR